MITKLDHHLAIPLDYAADLLDTLDLLTEIVRYADHELRHALADTDDWASDTYDDLTSAIDHHADVLRRATSPHTRTATP